MIWQLAFYLLAVTKEYEIMKQRNSVSDDEHILMARIIYKIGMESSQQLSWGRYDDFLSIDFDQFQRYIHIYSNCNEKIEGTNRNGNYPE